MKMLKIKIYSTPHVLGNVGTIADVKYVSIDASYDLWGNAEFPTFLEHKFNEELGAPNAVRLDPSEPDLIRRNGIKLAVEDFTVFTRLDITAGPIVERAVEEFVKLRDNPFI